MSEKAPSTSKVLISYSRKDKEFVKKLNDYLDVSGAEAWVDWEGIPPSADWMKEISSAIEASDAFLFVISPDSVASRVCGDELQIAVNYNKKLIPILYRELPKGAALHEKVAATNWIYLRDQDDFETNFKLVLNSINTDLEWVRQHTRLLSRANEWEAKKRDTSFLLQGADLDEAERWMSAAATSPDRQVLPLQIEYIHTSRKIAARNQRRLLIGVSLALVVSVLLGIFAFFQYGVAVNNENARATQQAIAEANEVRAKENETLAKNNEALAKQNETLAKHNAEIARAQRNAAEAQLYQSRAGQLGTSTLLAIDSWRNYPDFQAEQILRQNISRLPVPVSQAFQNGKIYNVQVSPDGQTFVSASADNQACVYDVQTGTQQFCIKHSDIVYDAIYSRDGKSIYTACADGKVYFWNASDGKQKQEAVNLGGAVYDLDASPDGHWLAAGSQSQKVYILDLSNSRQFSVMLQQVSPVKVVIFSPDSKWLGIGMSNGRVRLIRPASGVAITGPQHTDEVLNLAFSPDSTLIVSVGADSYARVAKTSVGGELYARRHGDWVEDVAFGPDGSWFVTVSDDNRVWVWDTKTGEEKLRLRHNGFVQEVKISPDGQWIASTGWDRTVRIFDAYSGSEMLQIPLEMDGTTLAFSHDGSRIIIGDELGNIEVWNISALKMRIGYIVFPEFVHEIRISPSGQWLFANSDDRKVWALDAGKLLETHSITNARALISAETLTYGTDVSSDSNWLLVSEKKQNRAILYSIPNQRATYLLQGSPVLGVAFSPDNSLAALAGGEAATVSIWDVQSGQKSFDLDTASPALSVAFSPDGNQLAIGTPGKTQIWDLATKTLKAELAQAGDISVLLYSRDGAWLASADSENDIYIWDAAGQTFDKPVYIFRQNGKGLAMAFSPDLHWLAVGSSDAFAYIWDMESGKEIARLPHNDLVTGLTFSIDGKMLITVSRKVAQVWDTGALPFAPETDLVKIACSRLTRNVSEAEWPTIFVDEPYTLICPDLPAGH
jgi:WD40 repeat protein